MTVDSASVETAPRGLRSPQKIADETAETMRACWERQVASVPDNEAVVTDDESLTYRELDAMANGIALKLAECASDKSRPVALIMSEGPLLYAAILGAIKANRIFIPLSAREPEAWLSSVVNDAGATLIVTDRSWHRAAERMQNVAVLVLDASRIVGSAAPPDADGTASPNTPSHIAYTSGSTGRPKGVVWCHRTALSQRRTLETLFGLRPGDRVATIRSISTSSGLISVLFPLLSGACLLPFDLRTRGLQELAPWLVARRITGLSSSASLWRTWLATLPDDFKLPMRFVRASGERLYGVDVARIAAHLEGDWRIVHSLSMSEASTIVAQIFGPSNLPGPGIVAVGRPTEGREIWLENEDESIAGAGQIGEIIAKSRFFSLGYWNQPELTATVFGKDPRDGVPIFRTGDLGRWRSDGTLEYLGRKGRRIRLRGYSIEPFEVECELLREPDVTDAIAVLHEGHEPVLVGYVIAPPGASPSAIRHGLAKRLPSHMVPSHIVVLDGFPLKENGKVDRAALPSPQREKARPVAHRAPADEHEHALAAIWQDVLNIPQIGMDDDFFELGGTSLQALRIFARIEADLGRSLSPTTIVHAPSIARLAEFTRLSTDVTASEPLVPLRLSGRNSPIFLVHNRYCFVMYYRHLLNHLKSDRPVFGLQPPPLDARNRIPRTIQAMAAAYVPEIRRVQPQGPYFLAGHSFGGRVAFEIAQQLAQAGERVEFLGLMDTALHDGPADPWRVLTKAGFRSLLVRSLRLVRAVLIGWPNDLRIRLRRSVPLTQRPLYYDWLCTRANRVYVPKPYPGHITMFSSAGNSERQKSHWGRIARGGLTVREIPAGHDDMVLPPHSERLAEYFDACLASSET